MPVPDNEVISPRRLVRDEVFIRLLNAIVDGALLPGEQLYDAEIEKWVGASRTPVREALNHLATMGLVEILPQKRTRVTLIDMERLCGLIDTLNTLFQSVVRDTTPLLTADDKEQLQSFAAHIESDDDLDALVHNRVVSDAFLSVYIRRLDNRTIAHLAERHLPEIHRALNATSDTGVCEKGIPHLRATVDASLAGDADAAAQGIYHYWLNAKEQLTTALENKES